MPIPATILNLGPIGRGSGDYEGEVELSTPFGATVGDQFDIIVVLDRWNWLRDARISGLGLVTLPHGIEEKARITVERGQ